jgi:hypothetical protein
MKNAGGHSILNDRLPIEKRYAEMVDKALEPRIAALNNSDLSGGEGSRNRPVRTRYNQRFDGRGIEYVSRP